MTLTDFSFILTSSVIAASLTSVVNWLIMRNNFRNDYFKKVIEKRMAVYDKVYSVMGRLQIINISERNLKSHAVFLQKSGFEDFNVELAVASLDGIWLSSNCSKLITSLNSFINEKFNNENFKEADYYEILDIAETNYEYICTFREQIRDQIMMDLLNLHEVEKFLKTKN